MALISNKVAPALLAGCTVILKSSPEAPGEGYLIAEAAEAVGLPPACSTCSPPIARCPGCWSATRGRTRSPSPGRRGRAADRLDLRQRIAHALELGGSPPR
jgi:hypothetical protein